MTNPYLSERTAAGGASDVAVEWDRGNDQWWDRYMSLADGPAPAGPLAEPAPHDPASSRPTTRWSPSCPITEAQVASFRDESFVKLP